MASTLRYPLCIRSEILRVEDDDKAQERGSSPVALASVLEPFSPMALHVHRTAGAVVGRQAEQDAIRQELASAATGRLAGLAVEGEPGIGKTRLLLAAAEMASAAGFTTIAVTADEELRGPFLLARSILGSPEAIQATTERPETAEALARSLDSMSGQDDPGLATLPADRRLLRTFDLGAVAFRALAAAGPLAVLVDDLQWSDDDSLRMLRYVIRSVATSPIYLMLAIRPEELALVTEAVNLLADMDRMGLLRRMKVDRLTQSETRDLVASVLGGPVDASGAAVMHAQAEGVPFIVEEMARAYRDGGMIQQIDGVWRLARNAERLVPSAVKTLISRRAAHLPDETKALLADAAVLGRRFSLEDLREVELRVDETASDPATLALALAPAVSAGLLVEHAEQAAADYSFQHEQVRDFAAGTLTQARRQALHAAIVALLLSGEPSPESLPLLAYHAKAAGDAAVCVRFSIEASRNALAANAPEEVLRVIELALPSAASSQERLDLLEARDRALDMLRRPSDRLEGLAELAALAEALGDSHLELDVRLRRAAALRTAEEYDRAAQLAREVRDARHRARRSGCRARGVHGAGTGPPARERGRGLHPRRTRRGPRRRGRSVPARDRPREGAGRRPDPRSGAPRDRRRPRREGPCLVHRTDAAGRAHRDRAARGRRGGARRHVARVPHRAARLRGGGALPGSARALRAARGPPRRDGVDHRDGVPELGAGHPSWVRVPRAISRRSAG